MSQLAISVCWKTIMSHDFDGLYWLVLTEFGRVISPRIDVSFVSQNSKSNRFNYSRYQAASGTLGSSLQFRDFMLQLSKMCSMTMSSVRALIISEHNMANEYLALIRPGCIICGNVFTEDSAFLLDNCRALCCRIKELILLDLWILGTVNCCTFAACGSLPCWKPFCAEPLRRVWMFLKIIPRDLLELPTYLISWNCRLLHLLRDSNH